MPKLKTHKSVSKRLKVTGSGKVKRAKAYKRHLLTGKSTKTKRGLRKTGYISDANIKAVRALLPNA
jgi:large subunit ribosomal protein L35